MKLIIDFFLAGGILMTSLIFFLLFKQKKTELPQKILLFFFGLIFFYILSTYADFNDLDILNFLTFIFDDVTSILIGPVIYIYINSIFIKNYKFKKYFLHLVPSFIYLIFVSVPILISILVEKFIFEYLNFLNTYRDIIFLIFSIYMLCYFIISTIKFEKFKKAIKSNFSNIIRNDFQWIYHLLVGLLIIGSLDLIISLLDFYSYETIIDSNFLLLIPSVALVFYLGYYGITQQKVLLPNFLLNDETIEIHSKKSTKKIALNFSKEELLEIENNLNTLLEKEKPFLDEDLTLQKLAKSLDLTDKKLSTFLNQYLKISFYDLINKHRIIAVKEKMSSKEYDNITLIGIACDSGFKSKTSFNRIFKKEVGLSPSAYKKSL